MKIITPAQIDMAITARFTEWRQFLLAQQATPTILIATGHAGDKRSEPGLVLSTPPPDNLPIDFVINGLEAALQYLKAERDKFSPGIILNAPSTSSNGE